MSVLDQAFIKAFSQQNSALEPAAAETAKKIRKQHSASQIAAPKTEEAKTVHATPSKDTEKTGSKRKTKSVDESASDSVFAAMEQKNAIEPASVKIKTAKRTAAAKGTKKTTASGAAAAIDATNDKSAKKTKAKVNKSSARPSEKTEKIVAQQPVYRLDPPVSATGGDASSSRSIVPGPHTDVIFSSVDNLVPRRDLTPNRTAAPIAEASSSKNAAEKKAEPNPDKKTVAEKPAVGENRRENQLPQTIPSNWLDDPKPAALNSAPNQSSESAESADEPETTKTPAEIFESLAFSMKQYSLSQVPLPEKSLPRETTASNKPLNPEKKVAVEKRIPPIENREKSEISERKTLPEKPPVTEAPAAPAIRLFQPMLQVDHFTWPKVCGRLDACSTPELESVIETLIASQIRNKKVFVMGGCHSGDGATSLLLSTARQLALQDVRVALVDADWSQPQLARRLGLLPQYGWEDVLAGHLPLEEVLIESIAEKLVVLPVREPFGESDLPGDAVHRLAESWNSLRRHFDFVLVDSGPLRISPILDPQFAGAMAGRIDAAILIKNVREQNTIDFDASLQGLQNVGTKVIGVIENFVG